MWKKILIAVAAVFVLLIIVVAVQPTDYKIERKGAVGAPPSVVFPHINNLHKWETWSPWAKRDPNAKTAFEGPEEGEGAVFKWAGNSEIGEGKMTVMESVAGEKVALRLDFEKPFKDTAMAVFSLKEKDGGTEVTWTMTGKNNFIGKAFSLMMDMDKMVGGDFEKGLASMKTEVEKAAKE